MSLFHTIVHPTDFDAPSVEAFRIARTLAQQLGARLVAFHVAAPPAVVVQDGRVILDPNKPAPVDLWTEYRTAQADTPGITVEYSVLIGKADQAMRMLREMIGQNPAGVLVVMGSHGRTGLLRMIWGSRTEEVVRTAPCAVLIVKEPATGSATVTPNSPSE